MDALPALEFVDRPAAAFAAEVRNTGNRKSGEAELCDTTGMHVDHREILATAFSILAVRCDWTFEPPQALTQAISASLMVSMISFVGFRIFRNRS